MKPVNHPLAIAILTAMAHEQSTRGPCAEAERAAGRLSTEYLAAERVNDLARDAVSAAGYAWRIAGCPMYVEES